MGSTPDILPSLETLAEVDAAMYRLLRATVDHEDLVSARDKEILEIQKRFSSDINKALSKIVSCETQIEMFVRLHPESMDEGKKCKQLHWGLMGLRPPANPALVPLNDHWSWERVADKARELWNKRYFHKPKPPGLDKIKLKKELDAKQLKELGLKLDDFETFYVDLNRVKLAEEATVHTAA